MLTVGRAAEHTGARSARVTVNEPDDVLPRASVAEHVTAVVPSGNTLPLAGVHVTTSVPSTKSVAIVEKDTGAAAAVAWTVMAAGTVSVGGVVSRTMTLNAPADAMP